MKQVLRCSCRRVLWPAWTRLERLPTVLGNLARHLDLLERKGELSEEDAGDVMGVDDGGDRSLPSGSLNAGIAGNALRET